MPDPSPAPEKTSPPEEGWKEIPLSDYRAMFADMVHFSTKTVNSNAEAGGIRLTSGAGLKRPYLSVRTLMGAGLAVALDYQKNVGAVATMTKQLRAAWGGQAPAGSGQALCAAYAAILDTAMASGIEEVSPRLRQLLLPRSSAPGGYLSVSPISSAGTAALITDWTSTHNKAIKDRTKDRKLYRRIRTASLGFGGSNPQNVGSMVRQLQSLVVVEAPTESPGLRAALALHFKGPEVRMPARAVADYALWRAKAIRRHKGRPTDLLHRNEEKDLIQTVARLIQSALAVQYRLLQRFAAQLPQSAQPDGQPSLFAQQVSEWRKSLVEPGWRQPDWARLAGWELAGALLRHRDDGGQTLGLGDDTQRHLGDLIAEVLT